MKLRQKISWSKPLLHTLTKKMPNAKGGKGYKKGKHTEDEQKVFEFDPSEGEMLGRVLRPLGNRRFRVYCNDNKERICKLAGSIRKSQWCDEGSIVLLVVREMGNAFGHATATNKDEIADILAIVETKFYGKLKKMEGVNIALFANLHDQDMEDVKKRVAAGQTLGAEDDLFNRGESSDEEEQEEGDTVNQEEKKKAKELARAKKEKERDLARGAKRDEKQGEEFNIDDI